MPISTDSYTAVAGQARRRPRSPSEVFKNAAETFTDQFYAPNVDRTEPAARYFEYLHKAVDLNREMATK